MKNRGISEEKERHFERLGETISELTLKGLFWGKNGAVSLEKERIKLNKGLSWYKSTKLLSAASSTYYAASGNAVSIADGNSFDLLVFFRIFWLWRALICLRKAEKYSDEFAKLKPMKDMSLGELDVRACILHKSGRRDEAKELLDYGIMKISSEQIGTKHDLCLFLIHKAEIIFGMKKYNEVEKNYEQAMKILREEAIPTLTKVRIMKSYGGFLIKFGRSYEARHLLNEAYFLAEENKLFDQTVKIKALLDACR